MSDKVNVCIIGAGAGGGTVAMLAAEAGMSVVVLDAGPRWSPAKDFVHDPDVMKKRFFWDMPVTSEGDPTWVRPANVLGTVISTLGHNSHGIGGGMNHWGASAYRLHPSDLQTKTLDGVGTDWPITYAELTTYYEKAEALIGVAGDHRDIGRKCPRRGAYPMADHKPPYCATVMKPAFAKLGLSTGECGGTAINSVAYDHRAPCNYCSFCNWGCPRNAKANSLLTQIPRAERAGAKIRPNCYAHHITVDKLGRAKSVLYFDEQGREAEQPADLVVVAGFTVETPRILLNSKSSLFPNGLANDHDQVGRYINTRSHIRVAGMLDEPVHGYRGIGGIGSHDYCETDPKHDFARGFALSIGGAAFLPEDFADMRGPLWGQPLQAHMADFVHCVIAGATGECLPNENNRVVLDPTVKDKYGIPAARIIGNYSENDKKIREFAIRTCHELLDAGGARKAFLLHSKSIGLHGACRMGRDPKSSVVNASGQTHSVRNLFIADSSPMVTGGCGPVTLTTIALALKTGEYIARNFADIVKL